MTGFFIFDLLFKVTKVNVCLQIWLPDDPLGKHTLASIVMTLSELITFSLSIITFSLSKATVRVSCSPRWAHGPWTISFCTVRKCILYCVCLFKWTRVPFSVIPGKIHYVFYCVCLFKWARALFLWTGTWENAYIYFTVSTCLSEPGLFLWTHTWGNYILYCVFLFKWARVMFCYHDIAIDILWTNMKMGRWFCVMDCWENTCMLLHWEQIWILFKWTIKF
jgi:hypothetical protein